MLLTDGVQDRDTRAKRVHQDLVSAASRGLPCVTAESLPAHTDVAGRALSSSKCSCCNYPRWCGFRGCGWCACLAAGGVHETVLAGFVVGSAGHPHVGRWNLGQHRCRKGTVFVMYITQPVRRPRTRGPCQLRVPVADDEPQSDRDKRVTAATEACLADRQSFQEELNRQRREIETKVADNLERLQVLYAPPKTLGAYTPTNAPPVFSAPSGSSGGSAAAAAGASRCVCLVARQPCVCLHVRV